MRLGSLKWLAAGIGALTVAGAAVAVTSPPAKTHSVLIHPSVPLNGSVGSVASGVPGRAPGARSSVASVAGPAVASGAGSGVGSAVPVGPLASGPAPGSPDLATADTAPKVVRTGQVSLDVAKGGLQSAFDRVAAIAQDLGGFVVTSSIGAPTPEPLPQPVPDGIDPSVSVPSSQPAPSIANGSLDLRVPSDRFDAARRAIEGVGSKVVSEQLSGNDASGQLVDLGARITDLQSEEAALRAIAARATTSADLLAVQPQLFEVRGQIEQLQAQQARLSNEVALASIHVELSEAGAASSASAPRRVAHASTLARDWSRAGAGLQAVIGGMLVVLGYALPLAVLGLLIGFPVAAMRRRRRHLEPAIEIL